MFKLFQILVAGAAISLPLVVGCERATKEESSISESVQDAGEKSIPAQALDKASEAAAVVEKKAGEASEALKEDADDLSEESQDATGDIDAGIMEEDSE